MSRLNDLLLEEMENTCPLCGSDVKALLDIWACEECECTISRKDTVVRIEVAMIYHDHELPIDPISFLYHIHLLRDRAGAEFS